MGSSQLRCLSLLILVVSMLATTTQSLGVEVNNIHNGYKLRIEGVYSHSRDGELSVVNAVLMV